MSLNLESGNRGELARLHATASNLHEVDAEVSAADVDLVSLRAPAPAEDRIVKLPSGYDQHPERASDNEPQRRAFSGRPMAIGLLALVAAITAGYLYWDHARRFVSTDDAFIAARAFPIASKVSGYITAVPVTDNQHVNAGDVISQIDDRDYRVALDQAQAQVDNAGASIENIDALASVQEAQISVNQAQVEQAQAALEFAEQQAERYQELAQKGSGTIQNAQQYASQLRQQRAALAAAQATIKMPERQAWALKKQHNSAVANLAQVSAQRDQAQLNFSYTTVKAAQAGRVVNLTVAVGQFAQVGTNLTMFVPDEIWVTANFKETQLDDMRPDQPVTVAIDAYPGRTISGHVASIQPGSGTAFSLLPAENATGNYVKIVQRVPVKIVLDNPPADVALGPGMSVVPRVRVNPNLSLYERLRSWL
jgi:membrane fusion protein (multidrug efflux system)